MGRGVAVERRWCQYCRKKSNYFHQQLLGGFPGANLVRRAADRLGLKIVPFRKSHRMRLLNLIRCEAHREVLETLLDPMAVERCKD